MRRLALVAALGMAGPVPAFAQPPTTGLAIHKDKASGVEVRFVNYPWRPDVFQTMEQGGAAPEGQRSWAFASLTTQGFFGIDEKPIPPGHYVLVLTPKTGSIPMTLEVRRVDAREVFVDLGVMAPPPGGETVYKAPATFATAADPMPALDVTLAGWNDGVTMTVRYGNRKLTKDLVRAMP